VVVEASGNSRVAQGSGTVLEAERDVGIAVHLWCRWVL